MEVGVYSALYVEGLEMKKVVLNKHHLIYESDKQKEVIRLIRKGVHEIVSKIRRYNYLTDEEINTIIIEAELKRKFN